jgi:hypothetical protein
MTKIVNYRTDKCDVRIDRTTKWGNPFLISVHGDRDSVILQYKLYLLWKPDLINSLEELRDKTLGCW